MAKVYALLFCVLAVKCITLMTESIYSRGTLPCKLYNVTSLDCTYRNLSFIPPLPPNITSIDLTDNVLRQISSTDFFKQTELIYIACSFNNIVSIKGSPFSLMSQLKALYLDNNAIGHLNHDVFKGLFNLRILELSSNKIKSISENLFVDLVNLQDLTLADNLLFVIPHVALSHLVSLQNLDLSWNYITNFTLGDGFKKLSNLSFFNFHCILDHATEAPVINNNTFHNLAEAPLVFLKFMWDSPEDSVHVIVEEGVFSPLKHITTLWTMYDLINEIPKSLDSELQMLKILVDAPQYRLTNTTLQKYAKWNASLTYLDISLSILNSIEDRAFVWFPELLILDLQGFVLPLTHIGDEAFYGLDRLEELYLARNHLNALPANAFKAFANSDSLRVLDLSYNCLNGAFLPGDFSSVVSLTHLNLSHNPIYMLDDWMNTLTNLTDFRIDFITSEADFLIPDLWKTPLQHLRSISFTNPNNKNILFITPFSLSERAPNLKKLNFESTYIFDIATIINLTKLEEIDISGSLVNTKKDILPNWGNHIYYPSLQVLKMESNEMTYEHVYLLKLNQTVPTISTLDLRNNLIEHIDSYTLLSLRYLQRLDLGNNRLLEINAFFVWQPLAVATLDLSQNSISDVPVNFVLALQEQNYGALDLSGNPFACTCVPHSIEPFRKWILSDTKVFLQSNLMYKCLRPSKLSGRSVTEINLDCASHLLMYLGIGISSGLLVFLSAVVAIRYRWHIRYGLFLMFHRRRKYQPLEEYDDNANDMNLLVLPRYDAFVSYAHDSDHDLEWVLNDLRLNLEEGAEPFRLCIGHARDFIPGTPLLEAITEAIHHSRKTIVVLTPSYLESEWCYFETQHAWLRLLNEGQDVLILILLEPIPDDKMTMWLRQFLLKKGYLVWPPDKAAQNLFFRCLRELIKEPTAVNRRYDV